MNEKIKNIEKSLSIKIRNKSLLIEALTHKSANREFNNEKLEFLGDRVIGLILSKKLIDLYPNKDEGILDKRFAKLVNRKTCANIARNNGIKSAIIMAKSNDKIVQRDEKILSDTCEALIGAIYIDRGFNYVKEFVLRLWKNEIKKSNVTLVDSKTKLQEYSLKRYRKLPTYKLISSKGPKHDLVFKISVKLYDTKEFIGSGNSKKNAEQNAAEKLLNNIA